MAPVRRPALPRRYTMRLIWCSDCGQEDEVPTGRGWLQAAYRLGWKGGYVRLQCPLCYHSSRSATEAVVRKQRHYQRLVGPTWFGPSPRR